MTSSIDRSDSKTLSPRRYAKLSSPAVSSGSVTAGNQSVLSTLHHVQQADMFAHAVCTTYRASDILSAKLRKNRAIGSSKSGGESWSPRILLLCLVAQNNQTESKYAGKYYLHYQL